MQRFTSNSETLQGAGSRDLSPSHAPRVDGNAGGVSDVGAQQSAATDAADETITGKLSARERLDHLSSFRINLDAISFTSSTSHRGGGKAKVVQATIRRAAGNEETVAVKKLHYQEGLEIRKFSNE